MPAAKAIETDIGSRARWLTLVAMTIANSMILVDQTAVPLATPNAVAGLGASMTSGQWILTANILPLAALMVFGGRIGDQRGLRRVFLVGVACFTVSSALAGFAPTMSFLIVMRVTQGVGAALMMPTTIAIVAFVFPSAARGRALGLMAGASAFFAAMGPVLGGLLTQYVDWRAVFWINVPLALIVGVLAVTSTPPIAPAAGGGRSIDLPGVATFAVGIGALTLGLGQGSAWGWGSLATVGMVLVGVAALMVFVAVDRRARDPLIRLALFRIRNFTAANISQVLAGMIELAARFLLPYFLLLVIGLSPGAAGLALLPATIPIIIAAPLAGRWFDKVGGRIPLTVGFLVLAASCVALVIGFADRSAAALAPGLVLQGIGLGIVLTVNDPTGINAVPEDVRGQASGVIDTSEQFGGALGIAVLTALYLQYLFDHFFTLVQRSGASLSASQNAQGTEYVLRAEQKGLEQVQPPKGIARLLPEFLDAHVAGYRFVYVLAGCLALIGAVVSFVTVQRGERTHRSRIFSRRSRWAWATTGGGPGMSRKLVPGGAPDDHDGAGST